MNFLKTERWSRRGAMPLTLGLALAVFTAGCQPDAEQAADVEPVAADPVAANPAPDTATPAADAANLQKPDFTLTSYSGETFDLSEEVKDGPVLVSFFNPE